MIIDLIKAVLVGICAAVPVGPVLFQVLQRTLRYGRGGGLAAGAGSALADTLYAAVGLFALSLIKNFINSHEAVIMLIGGLFITVLGAVMFFSKNSGPEAEGGPEKHVSGIGFALQTFLSAISNPAALAMMMAFLAIARLDASSATAPVWAILPCVTLGEMLWWLTVTGAVSRFLHVTPRTVNILGKVAGAAIVAFGIVLIIKGLIAFS